MKKIQLISLMFAAVLTVAFMACKKKSSADPEPQPTASFSYSNGGCIGPCTVTFTNTSQNATTYSWDFGDGSSSTDQSPSHAYAAAGTFTVTLTATGTGGNNTTQQSVTIGSAQYYLRYKVDGVSIAAVDFTATRGISTSPRTLVINGSAASGANPVFKFSTEESFIGFTSGLNVGCSNSTMPSEYINFTNSTGIAFSTANDAGGISLFFSSLSYTNGGVAIGTFSGSVKTTSGTIAQITNGEFKLKFNN